MFHASMRGAAGLLCALAILTSTSVNVLAQDDVGTHMDPVYGKTQQTGADHRHWELLKPGQWSPWHNVLAPHVWGQPAPKPAPKPAPVASNTASMHFPSAVSGNAKDCCAKVHLDKSGPSSVSVGEPFAYNIKATNSGNVEVRDVVVTDVLPAGFKMSGSTPAAAGTSGDKTMWNLGSLAPGQSKTITINGAASGVGELINCTTVSFVPYICIRTAVVQPALKITKTAPKQVLLCDPIPVTITVTNPGSGAAKNVVVTDNLPAGLTTMDGKTSLTTNVGTLAAGQSKTIKANLKASKRGTYNNTASASAAGNLTATASTSTEVLEPVLTITKAGPAKVFVGRMVKYQIKVANTGNGPARNTVVTDTLPSAAQFVSASAGGKAAGGKVTWNLGTLNPGESRSLDVAVKGTQIANLLNKATTSATCAKPVSAQAPTQVAGIPAILLEVIDIEDPIEVGATTTYVITATNQGSLPGKNVTIACTLENSQQHVSNSGATAGTVTGQVVKFAPLPSLAPKAKATWKVVIKAVQAGDVRFSVQMDEDQLTRPVNETEATNQY